MHITPSTPPAFLPISCELSPEVKSRPDSIEQPEASSQEQLPERIDFEHMTRGQLFATLDRLVELGELTPLDCVDIQISIPWPIRSAFPPGTDMLALPALISYDHMTRDLHTAISNGDSDGVNRIQRAMDFMKRMDGKMLRFDDTA